MGHQSFQNNGCHVVIPAVLSLRKLDLLMIMIEFPPGLCCETTRNAMNVSAQRVRHQKRERCLENHRSSPQYQYYKEMQADCDWLPQTPRPLAYESKNGWEKAIFTWRNAMKVVYLIYS